MATVQSSAQSSATTLEVLISYLMRAPLADAQTLLQVGGMIVRTREKDTAGAGETTGEPAPRAARPATRRGRPATAGTAATAPPAPTTVSTATAASVVPVAPGPVAVPPPVRRRGRPPVHRAAPTAVVATQTAAAPIVPEAATVHDLPDQAVDEE